MNGTRSGPQPRPFTGLAHKQRALLLLMTRATPEDPAEKFLSPADIMRQIALESGMRFVTVEEDEDERETFLEALEEDPWMRDAPIAQAAPEDDARFLFGLDLDPQRPSRSAYDTDEVRLITAQELLSLAGAPRGDATTDSSSTAPESGDLSGSAAEEASAAVLIVDIRDPVLFAMKHIPWTTYNIPLERLTRQLHRDKFAPGNSTPVVLVSESGVEDQFTKQAYVRLRKVFQVLDVRVLDGGLAAWEAARQPLIMGPSIDESES